ncbi:response regulator [bacterium]|nr:response regulator [bacterium]
MELSYIENLTPESRRIMGLGTKRLLVVEDDPILIRFWKRFQSHLPFYKMIIETDPHQALETLAEDGADILLTDLAMPAMSGLELIRRALKINATLKTVLTTGHMPQLVDTAMEDGFLHIIPKPYKNLKNLESFLSMLGENTGDISQVEKSERLYVWNL